MITIIGEDLAGLFAGSVTPVPVARLAVAQAAISKGDKSERSTTA